MAMNTCDAFEAMEHLKYDNNVSETDIYQIYEDGGKELDTLPAEHLYVLRNTAFSEANMDIIVKAISNLGRKFINRSSPVDVVRRIYNELVENEGLYARMCARAVEMLDLSMKEMNRAGELLEAYLKREEKAEEIAKADAAAEAEESGEMSDYDPRGFENIAYEVDELRYQISTNFANTLLRRRMFVEYEGELIVEDGGIVGV